MFLQDFGAGGGRPPELQNFLQGGPSGEHLVWLRDLEDNPQDWAYHWQIIPKGRPLSGNNPAEARHDGTVGVPAS